MRMRLGDGIAAFLKSDTTAVTSGKTTVLGGSQIAWIDDVQRLGLRTKDACGAVRIGGRGQEDTMKLSHTFCGQKNIRKLPK